MTRARTDGSLPLADGLVLHAPGGVLLPAHGETPPSLVTADLHLGYTPTLRAKGYAVPAAGDDELIARVRAMLGASGARALVVAGDFVHGAAATRTLAAHDASALTLFVRAMAPVAVRVVLGNHDRRAARAIAEAGVEVTLGALALGPYVVHHGDDPAAVRAHRARAIERGGRVIIGHLHPALALDDGAGARATVPAFVCAPGLLCLPALAPFARGGDVRSDALRAQLSQLVDADEAHGAAVVVGGGVVAVGDVWRTKRRAPVGGRRRVEEDVDACGAATPSRPVRSSG